MKAYRLAYRSQRETPCDRALSGAFGLRRKLGADGGIGDYITKPKGMHWRTFERVMGRIDRAEAIVRRAHRSPARSPQPGRFPIANFSNSLRLCAECWIAKARSTIQGDPANIEVLAAPPC